MSLKKAIIFVLIPLVGCSFSFSSDSSSGESLEKALLESQAEQMEDGVELIWEIPTSSVTKYNIYFGDSRDNLSLYKTVMVSDLERLRHDQFGPVFRYVVTGLTKKCGIYVSLEAENAAGKSPRTVPRKLRCKSKK